MSSELERKLLARLDTPEAIAEVWERGTRAEHFEQPLYQAVFNFVIDYWQKSRMKAAPTPWALAQEYPGYTIIDDSEETTEFLVAQLNKRYAINQLQEMLRDAAANSVNDPVGTLKSLQAAAFEASENATPRITRLNVASEEAIQRFWSNYAAAEDYPQGLGVPYGLDLLDLFTGGILPGELAVLGGFAKTGKTMFGLHAVAKAVRQGYRPLVYTLEMSLDEVHNRLLAMFSEISYDRILHKRLSDEEKDRLHAAEEELRPLYDKGGIQVERPDVGDRTVASLLARARHYGTDYLFIDQLSKMEAGIKTQTLKEHHGTIVTQLKNGISQSGVEIPCLLAAQFRRGDEEISMESFANAAEIEREADIMLGLWRNQDLRNNGQMVCKILGSRRSDVTSFLLNWELGVHTRITVEEEIRESRVLS